MCVSNLDNFVSEFPSETTVNSCYFLTACASCSSCSSLLSTSAEIGLALELVAKFGVLGQVIFSAAAGSLLQLASFVAFFVRNLGGVVV